MVKSKGLGAGSVFETQFCHLESCNPKKGVPTWGSLPFFTCRTGIRQQHQLRRLLAANTGTLGQRWLKQAGVYISQRTGSLEAAGAGRAQLLGSVVQNWGFFQRFNPQRVGFLSLPSQKCHHWSTGCHNSVQVEKKETGHRVPSPPGAFHLSGSKSRQGHAFTPQNGVLHQGDPSPEDEPTYSDT